MTLKDMIAEGGDIPGPNAAFATWTRYTSKVGAYLTMRYPTAMAGFEKAAKWSSFEDDDTVIGRLLGYLEGLDAADENDDDSPMITVGRVPRRR